MPATKLIDGIRAERDARKARGEVIETRSRARQRKRNEKAAREKKTARQQDREKRHPGVMRDDETYTVEEVGLRFGLGRTWVRQAIREGLKKVPTGRNAYMISGRALREFLEKRAKAAEWQKVQAPR